MQRLAVMVASVVVALGPRLARAESLTPIVQAGHGGGISAVAASPDGTMFASAGHDGLVKIWDAATLLELRTLRAHEGFATGVAFLPGGRRLLSGGHDDLVRLWDVDSGRELMRWSIGRDVKGLLVPPDGKSFVAVAEDLGTTRIERYVTDGPGRFWSTSVPAGWLDLRGFALAPDGAAFAVAFKQEVHVFEVATGQERTKLPGGHLAAYKDASTLVLRDARSVVLARALDGSVVQRFPTSTAIALSPDGRTLVTYSTDEIKGDSFGSLRRLVLFDTATGQERGSITAPSGYFESAIATADGALLAGTNQGALYLFDLATQKERARATSVLAAIDTAAITADGHLVTVRTLADRGYATMGGEIVSARRWTWDVGHGDPREAKGQFQNHRPAVLSADGRRAVLAQGDKPPVVVDATSGKTLGPLAMKEGMPIAISADGKVVAARDYTGAEKVVFFDTDKRSPRGAGTKLEVDVKGAVFTRDAKRLLLVGSFDTVFFDAASARQLSTTRAGTTQSPYWRTLHGCDVGADGKRQVCARVQNEKAEGELVTVEGGSVRVVPAEGLKRGGVLLTPDGARAANAGGLYDVASGRRLWAAEEEPLGFDRTAELLFGRDPSGMLVFRRVADGVVAARVYAVGASDWVIVTPDGRFDGTEAGMRTLHFVAANRPVPLASQFERFYTPRLLERVLTHELLPPVPDGATGALKLPPRVVITRPADGAALEDETAEIDVEATADAAIEELRLYQGGKLVEEETRGLKRIGKEKRTFRVALLPGVNVLRAVAVTRERAEGAAEITVTKKGDEPKADLYVLAVGINDYENPKYRLGYGRPDAQAFAKALAGGGGRIFRKVVASELYDRDAGRAGILGALARVAAEARPEDVFVMFYAGHGAGEESTSDFFLVPFDVTSIYGDAKQLLERGVSASTLKAEVAKIRARKQLILLDACESGGAVATFAMRGAAEEKAIRQLSRSAGTAVLASTGNTQLAAELGPLGHGAFTYALLEGLRGKADGAPRDGKITVKELESWVEERVPELTKQHRGTPQYPNAFAVGQDFPLTLAP